MVSAPCGALCRVSFIFAIPIQELLPRMRPTRLPFLWLVFNSNNVPRHTTRYYGNQQAKRHLIVASPSCSHARKLHSCDAAHQMTWHIFEAGATSPANPNRRQHGVRRETPQGRRQRRPVRSPILRGHSRSKSCASRTEWNGPTNYQRSLGRG